MLRLFCVQTSEYAYVHNDPVNLVDPWGLMVAGLFGGASLGTPVAADSAGGVLADTSGNVTGFAEVALTYGYQLTADEAAGVIVAPFADNVNDLLGHAKRLSIRFGYSVDITIPDGNPWGTSIAIDLLPGIDFGFGIGEVWTGPVCP